MRRLAATLVASTIALGGGFTVTPPASSAAADPPPPLALRAAKTVKVKKWGPFLSGRTGVQIVAQGENFELRANRASYNDPIQTTWLRSSGNQVLPQEGLQNWSGLRNFVKITLTAKDGSARKPLMLNFCPGANIRRLPIPDAALQSKYPEFCPYNPYTLGSVIGLAQGWGSRFTIEQSSGLRPGRYEATASIQEPYVTMFGLGSDQSVTYTLEVVKPKKPRRFAPSARASTPLAADPQTKPEPKPATTRAGAPQDNAPDLRSLPAFGMQLNPAGTQLRFAATTWNAGPGNLVVDGYLQRGSSTKMDAYQFFVDENGDPTGHQLIGELEFHRANHQHWHFEDFARYRLLKEDMTQAVRSRKNSWCLAATDAVDYTVPRADWKPYNTDLSTACGGRGTRTIREVLQAGNGDTYYQYRAGQSFNIANLPDGKYYVSVEANPNGNIVETDTTNNDSVREITLGRNANGKRTLKMAKVGIINERSFASQFAQQRRELR
jgi:hypothetical protein